MFRWAMLKTNAAKLALRATELVAATAVVMGIELIAPVPALAQSAVSPYTVTPERMVASMAAVAALIAVVIGGLALARAAGRIGSGNGRRGAIVALVLAPAALITSGLVVVTADGGLGTGNGLAGGVVAMTVALIGMALGALALSRSRRAS